MRHSSNIRNLLFLIGVGAALPVALLAQAPSPAPADPVIKAGTEQVLLDLIVRDKKGRTVRDLEPSDVEVYDNGKQMKISSFRLVEGTAALQNKSKVALDPMRQIRLVTMVFQGLDDNGRRLSRQAALDLLKDDLGTNVFYAVFSLDTQLNAIQQYTNDRDLLRKAVERATSGLSTQFSGDTQRIRGQLETLVGPHAGQSVTERIQDMGTGAAGAHGPPANAINALQAQMVLNMLQFDENLANLQGGRATIFPLLALIRGQTLLPGRKTIVFFNSGLIIDPSLQSQFDAVISTANRANVSIYPVDARGLQSGRNTQSGTDALSGALAASKALNISGGKGAISPDEVKAADTAEMSIRSNAQNALRDLADGTGGAFIGETNDFRTPLRKLNEDVNTYYELTYDPHIETYDGRLRKIIVKTARADLKVQTRNGYFALPAGETMNTTLAPYEVPLLKALDTKPLPRTFDYRATGLRFQPAGTGVDCALVVEVPMKDITFTADASGVQRARISEIALVKDASGSVVHKISKDQPVQISADRLSGVKAGNFTSLEHFVLAPGRYTVESAVLDTNGDRISARKSILLVPPVAKGVSISSMSLVRRFDPNAADPLSPFVYNKGTVTPTLVESMLGEKGAQVSVFFTIYPDTSSTEKPTLTLEYLQEGKVVGRIQPELTPVDANGRIPYMASSPADQMPAGTYEVRAIVQQGKTKAEEHTTFTIEPVTAK